MDRVLARFYAATFLFSLAMGVGSPLVPQHLDLSFGASLGFIGVVVGLHGLMQIVLRLPMGDMADRRGRKPSLVATFVLLALAGVFYVLAPNAWWIVPGHMLFGLASGIYWVAANSYLFDRVPRDRMPRATSDYAMAIGAALLVAPPISGYIADEWGFSAGLSLFLWSSLLALALVATLPETPPDRSRPRPPGGVYARAWRILHHPDIAVSAMGTFLFSLLFGTALAFFPVYLRALAFTAFVVGMLFAARQGAALAVRAGLPRAISQFGPRAVLMAGIVVTAATTALIPFADGLVVLTLITLVSGAGTGVMIPANLTLVARGAPPDEKGLANGIYGTALGLGTASSAYVLGRAGDAWGIEWTFWLAAYVAGMGAIAMYAYSMTHAGEKEREVPAAAFAP